MARTFSEEKPRENQTLDATFPKGCCGDCEAFDPMGAGTNSPYRKFRAKAGYCLKTFIGNKPMTVYENNYAPQCVATSKFVLKKSLVVAIGK
jgi:hypothetical protein